jgi:hypothetical protein
MIVEVIHCNICKKAVSGKYYKFSRWKSGKEIDICGTCGNQGLKFLKELEIDFNRTSSELHQILKIISVLD